MKKLKICNVFGIKPATTGVSAGMDFFIPKFNGLEKLDVVLEAYEKSYGKSVDELKELIDKLVLYVTATKGEEYAKDNELNLLQLFLSLDSFVLNWSDIDDRVETFIDTYLVFDDNKTPGVCLICNDYVKINSGIKVALEHDHAAIFFNKSGKGTKGWDIRACVIDEDYTGYVHMSMCYNKAHNSDGTIYCGDKLVQLIVLPVKHTETEEITEEEYNALMDNSIRGSNGFGSSDVKH